MQRRLAMLHEIQLTIFSISYHMSDIASLSIFCLPSDTGMHVPIGNHARTAQHPAFLSKGSTSLHPWLQTGRSSAAKARHLLAHSSGRPQRAAPTPHSLPHFPIFTLPRFPLSTSSPSFRHFSVPPPVSQSPSHFSSHPFITQNS